MTKFRLDDEFKAQLPAQTEDALERLTRELRADGGPRDPLVVWRGIILDGMTRYEICREYGLPFRVVEKDFPSREEAAAWIDQNQLARRNLSTHERAMVLARIAKREKEKGAQNAAKAVAAKTGVARSTASRAISYARSVASLDPEVRAKVEGGRIRAGQNAVRQLACMPRVEQVAAVKKVEDGEFESLTDFFIGKPKETPNLDVPKPPEILTEQEKEAIFRSVDLKMGNLIRAIDGLSPREPTAHAQCIALLREIATTLETWRKQI